MSNSVSELPALEEAGQDISRAVDELDQVQTDISKVAESSDIIADTMSDSVSRAANALEQARQDVDHAVDTLDLTQSDIRNLAENLHRIANDTISP